jgi:hypothetical protein
VLCVGQSEAFCVLAANKGASRNILDGVLVRDGITLANSTLYRAKRTDHSDNHSDCSTMATM